MAILKTCFSTSKICFQELFSNEKFLTKEHGNFADFLRDFQTIRHHFMSLYDLITFLSNNEGIKD